MKIINAVWTPDINILIIKCACGNKIRHRADSWNVRCLKCQAIGNLKQLREEMMKEDSRISAIKGMQELPDNTIFTITTFGNCHRTIIIVLGVEGIVCHISESLEESISGAVCDMLTKMMEEEE